MKKTVLWLLALALLSLSVLALAPPYTAQAKTTQELEAEIRALDAQIEQYSKRIAANKEKKDHQQEYLNDLQEKAEAIEKKSNALQTQILVLARRIEDCNLQIKRLKNEMLVLKDEIKLTQTQIKETAAKIEETKSALQDKLRAAYISGNESSLKLLMGADSLASFLTRLEMMKRISEEDNRAIRTFAQLVSDLKAAEKTLVNKRETLEEKTRDLSAARKSLISRKTELLEKQQTYDAAIAQLRKESADIEAFIGSLAQDSDLYQNYIKKLRAERNAADREIDEIINARVTTTAPTTQTPAQSGENAPSETQTLVGSSGAAWLWPVASPCYISSGFGNRDPRIGGYAFHGGIDIADPNGSGVIYGRPIYASRAGVVVTASWGTTGYGNYVILDHGDGYATVYGHCSSLSVSAGQIVAQGQPIANVGESGNAKGAHLHFEVRYNGVKQNPLNYVRNP